MIDSWLQWGAAGSALRYTCSQSAAWRLLPNGSLIRWRCDTISLTAWHVDKRVNRDTSVGQLRGKTPPPKKPHQPIIYSYIHFVTWLTSSTASLASHLVWQNVYTSAPVYTNSYFLIQEKSSKWVGGPDKEATKPTTPIQNGHKNFRFFVFIQCHPLNVFASLLLLQQRREVWSYISRLFTKSMTRTSLPKAEKDKGEGTKAQLSRHQSLFSLLTTKVKASAKRINLGKSCKQKKSF